VIALSAIIGNGSVPVTFSQWLLVAVPLCCVALVLVWGFLMLYYPPSIRSVIRESRVEMGRTTEIGGGGEGERREGERERGERERGREGERERGREGERERGREGESSVVSCLSIMSLPRFRLHLEFLRFVSYDFRSIRWKGRSFLRSPLPTISSYSSRSSLSECGSAASSYNRNRGESVGWAERARRLNELGVEVGSKKVVGEVEYCCSSLM